MPVVSPGGGKMNKKLLVKELLLEQKYAELKKLAAENHAQTLRYIQMYLFEDINSPLRWEAIEALGYLAKEYGVKEELAYRNVIRRFLWAMNDESGNVPWSSPEAMGSIIANQPELFGEYTPMLITNALDNPMCHRGMLWAVGRIGKVNNTLVMPFIEKITPFLSAADADLRGYTLWALGEIGYREILPRLANVQGDQEKIYLYREGRLDWVGLDELAKEARAKLEKAV